MTDQKNVMIAIALSIAVLLGWQFFIVTPHMEAERAAQLQQQQAASTASTASPQAGAATDTAPAPQAGIPNAVAEAPVTRDEALARSPRVAIDTPSITGSINLRGGRIDDVRLKKYRETVDPESPLIVLFSPTGSPDPYYADFGVVGAAGGPKLPDAETVWTVESGDKLTPTTPVVITTTSDGVVFRRSYSIDADYMVTMEQSVENTGAAPLTLYPYGRIARYGTPVTAGYYVLHEGLLGVFGDRGLTEVKYKNLAEEGAIRPEKVTSGWLGITDKYWAATLIPEGDTTFQPSFVFSPAENGRREHFQADFLRDAVVVAPGATAKTMDRLFAGAKEVSIVDGYRTALDIRNFDLLIDWGWFYFITKPMFFLIDYIFGWVGNFGVAILLVTVLIKAAFFPLANKSYVSMSRMKLVQPQMTEIRERFKDDKAKQQQALMELYKKEKINPVAGCLPILIQIPVFFALYKVLFVTIEMRHAPFFGWIHDLAAPDPTTLFNLFGLIAWTPPHFLMIGVWPIVMGITMFVQMKLNPTPPDPTQAMVFTYMPIIFTFMLASFPAGLVIYWAWNNTLSVLQQAAIMKRQGVKIELWDNLKSTFRRKPKSAA